MKLSLLIIAGVLMMALGIHCKDKPKTNPKPYEKRIFAIYVDSNGKKSGPYVFIEQGGYLTTYDSLKKEPKSKWITQHLYESIDTIRGADGKPLIDSVTKLPKVRVVPQFVSDRNLIFDISYKDVDSLLRIDTLIKK